MLIILDIMDDSQDSKLALTHRSTPYPISRLAPGFSPVLASEEIAIANLMLGAVNRARLEVIVDQIRHLQEEAGRILDKAQEDAMLHNVEIRFQRRVGMIYHLYRRARGGLYMSMLSPEEWGVPPDEPMGSYRLELDQSWTRVDT